MFTWVVSAAEGVLDGVQAVHDDLPAHVHIVELGRLPRQLLADVLSQEDVLHTQHKKRFTTNIVYTFLYITGNDVLMCVKESNRKRTI